MSKEKTENPTLHEIFTIVSSFTSIINIYFLISILWNYLKVRYESGYNISITKSI